MTTCLVVDNCQRLEGVCRLHLQERRVVLLLIHSYPPPSLPHTSFLHLYSTSRHCITVTSECYCFLLVRLELLTGLSFHKLLSESLFCTHARLLYFEYGGSTFPRHAGTSLPNYTASHHSGKKSSCLVLLARSVHGNLETVLLKRHV